MTSAVKKKKKTQTLIFINLSDLLIDLTMKTLKKKNRTFLHCVLLSVTEDEQA